MPHDVLPGQGGAVRASQLSGCFSSLCLRPGARPACPACVPAEPLPTRWHRSQPSLVRPQDQDPARRQRPGGRMTEAAEEGTCCPRGPAWLGPSLGMSQTPAPPRVPAEGLPPRFSQQHVTCVPGRNGPDFSPSLYSCPLPRDDGWRLYFDPLNLQTLKGCGRSDMWQFQTWAVRASHLHSSALTFLHRPAAGTPGPHRSQEDSRHLTVSGKAILTSPTATHVTKSSPKQRKHSGSQARSAELQR